MIQMPDGPHANPDPSAGFAPFEFIIDIPRPAHTHP